MNLSNNLTTIRIILIPIFIILLINQYIFFAMVIFGIASLTDALDGIVARVRNQKTRLGFFLDPIADKLLLNTSFIALAIIKFIPAWLAIVVISRDTIIVLGVTAFYMVNEKLLMSPTYLSKSTTTAQMLTIMMALLVHLVKRMSTILWFFVWFTAVLTIISGFDYIYIAARMVNSEK